LVGLLEGKPFELFAGLEENLTLPKKFKTGHLIAEGKKGNKHYSLKIGEGEDEMVIHDILKVFDNPTFSTWTRQISLSLRHGVPIQYWCEQIVKSEDFTSFLRIITRILKKYIPEKSNSGQVCSHCGGKTEYIQGCLTCLDCGKSLCS